MIAEQQEQQIATKLIKSSYTVQNHSLDNAIYANRFYNDQMLGEIFAMAKANNQLSNKIEQHKRKSPKFLGTWWESDIGPQSMTVLLNKTEKILQDQIDFMAQSIRSNQRERQLSELQLEQQEQRKKHLEQRKMELQAQYSRLRQNNNQQERELEQIIQQREKFYQTLKQLQHAKGILQLEYNIHSDKVAQIQASTNHNNFLQAEKIYYQKLTAFLKHIVQRKCHLQEFNAQSKSQLDKINTLLENLQAERKGKQLRKQSIVTKHLQLKKLKEDLAISEQKRKQAQRRKTQLQKQYCQQQMQKLASDYEELQGKCNNILGKTLNLAKKSIDNTKIDPLSFIINRNNTQ